MRFPISSKAVSDAAADRPDDRSSSGLANLATKLQLRLFAPLDIASLVYFRIVFGALMVWEAWRYLDRGWVARYYIEPTFHFTYFGFGWVKPWPDDWMHVHFYALSVLAIMVMAGLFYRVSVTLFFLGFTYVFLLDQARYLNHFYLISLLSFLLIFVPAHRRFSVDALLRPGTLSDTAPSWALWIFRAQLAIVYFYAGLAKINRDWLRGEPLREWLGDRTDFFLIGPLFTEEWMVYLFSYGGLFLDLLVVPFLLWGPTRPYAFAAALAFHLLNAKLFPIGIFPWLAIAATLLFFPPEWPRALFGIKRREIPEPDKTATHLRPAECTVVGLLGVFLVVQVLLPLRHYLYPGNVSWTEEGHRFAWHMRLRDKEAEAQFFATDPMGGQRWEIDTDQYLTNGQESEMATRPDMILQFAHYIADKYREQGYEQIQVRVTVTATLNSRKPQLLIDPGVDLAAQPRDLRHARWILPLE